jgi:hypothetical protein
LILTSEVPLWSMRLGEEKERGKGKSTSAACRIQLGSDLVKSSGSGCRVWAAQGYLAHKKTPTPL